MYDRGIGGAQPNQPNLSPPPHSPDGGLAGSFAELRLGARTAAQQTSSSSTYHRYPDHAMCRRLVPIRAEIVLHTAIASCVRYQSSVPEQGPSASRAHENNAIRCISTWRRRRCRLRPYASYAAREEYRRRHMTGPSFHM